MDYEVDTARWLRQLHHLHSASGIGRGSLRAEVKREWGGRRGRGLRGGGQRERGRGEGAGAVRGQEGEV